MKVGKTCSSCKELKPFESFYRQRSSKSGYVSACKVCTTEHKKSTYDPVAQGKRNKAYREKNKEKLSQKQREYREKNKETLKAKKKARREGRRDYFNSNKEAILKGLGVGKSCSKCTKFVNYEDYSLDMASPDWHRSRCKPCASSAWSDWYSDNKDMRVEYRKKYREENLEVLRSKTKEHYWANKEYYQKKWGEWYQNNKSQKAEYDSKYQDAMRLKYGKNRELYEFLAKLEGE